VQTVLNAGSGTAVTPAINEARGLPRWVVGMDVTGRAEWLAGAGGDFLAPFLAPTKAVRVRMTSSTVGHE
jgi:hypothetical protein